LNAQEEQKADRWDSEAACEPEAGSGDGPMKKAAGFGKDAKADKAEASPTNEERATRNMVKFEVFGEEMLEKQVRASGNSGRVYLPPEWVGRRVKVIRMR